MCGIYFFLSLAENLCLDLATGLPLACFSYWPAFYHIELFCGTGTPFQSLLDLTHSLLASFKNQCTSLPRTSNTPAKPASSQAKPSKRKAFKMAEKRVPMTMRDFFFDDPFFQSSWEDFDKVRDAMFQESRDMWKRFDEDFRQMACMSNNIMVDMEQREERQRLESKKESTSSSSSKLVERKSSTEKATTNQPLARQDSIAR